MISLCRDDMRGAACVHAWDNFVVTIHVWERLHSFFIISV